MIKGRSKVTKSSGMMITIAQDDNSDPIGKGLGEEWRSDICGLLAKGQAKAFFHKDICLLKWIPERSRESRAIYLDEAWLHAQNLLVLMRNEDEKGMIDAREEEKVTLLFFSSETG